VASYRRLASTRPTKLSALSGPSRKLAALTLSLSLQLKVLIPSLSLVACGSVASNTSGPKPEDAGPAPGPIVVFASGVKQINERGFDPTVVMTDGRVLVLTTDAPRPLSVPPAAEIRDQSVLTRTGEVYHVWPPPDLSRSDRLEQTGPFTLYRNGWARGADGRVFAFLPYSNDVAELANRSGASACDSGEATCLFDGVAKDIDGNVIDVGGKVVEILHVNSFYPGINGSGIAFLREDGALFIRQTRDTNQAAANPLHKIELGLPPIAHLHPGFYEDFNGGMWYFGIANRNRWPPSLTPQDVARQPCTIPGEPKIPDFQTECLRPTAIPALVGTSPVRHGSTVLALTRDGKLLCWPNIGRSCPRGE